jgi:hypothetical protein
VPSELGKAVEGIGGAFNRINLPGQGGPGDAQDAQPAPANTSSEDDDEARPRPSAAPSSPAAGTGSREQVSDRPPHTPPRPRRLSPADVLYGAEDE